MTDSQRDEELLTAVTGLGEESEPDEQARARADRWDIEAEFDLRGSRDRDPNTPHPWRSS